MSLYVDKLSFSYKNHPVLDGISFSLASGEILVVLGENGVGKSTLLRCLCGLNKYEGQVSLDGNDLSKASPRDRAKAVGAVFQSERLFGGTVFQTVLSGRIPFFGQNPGDGDLARAEDAILRLGIEGLSHRRADRLSGGELQKTALSRLVCQDPSLLLLDEPTSSLDLKSRDRLFSLLGELKSLGKTVIVTMHDVNAALTIGDKLLLLKDGKQIFFGDRSLLTEDLVFEVYGVKTRRLTLDGRDYFL